MPKKIYISSDNHIKELAKDFQELGMRHSVSNVFTDYLVLAACAVSNSIDKLHFKEREKMYTSTIAKYNESEQKHFVEIHNKILNAMEQSLYEKDVLGELFHALNLSNSWNGQFFTPMHIAHAMAEITLSDAGKEINKQGYITIQEPTCGSGVMIIAAAAALLKLKLSPSHNMCVLAVDNDIRCAMMAYIQLSYLGIPAVVVHGDSLLVKEYARFYTPLYLMNGWLWKSQMSMTDKVCDEDIKMKKEMLLLFEKIIEKEGKNIG